MDGHDHSHHHHHHGHAEVDTTTLTDTQAICVVTGDVVEKAEAEKLGHFRDHAGKRYYFCCSTCVQLFDKNPEKYAHASHETGSLRLMEKEHLVDNVWAFRFTSSEQLSWVPGQFIRVEIPHDNPDTEGVRRWFTVSSTPHDGYLQITTRVTDTTFKQALASLSVGAQIKLIEKPDGDFVWQDDERPLVFIAGGIGITPYYSILKDRGHSGQSVRAILIYNGRDDQLPFREEFDDAAKRHEEFSVKYVIGERLTAGKLVEIVPELLASQVYISGPEPMVESLGDELLAKGLKKDTLHQDFFPNYTDENY